MVVYIVLNIIEKGYMAINLRPGCKGVIFAGLIPVGASWGQPVEPVVLEDLIAQQARRFVLRDGRR